MKPYNQKTEKKMIKVSRKKSKNIYSIKKSFYTFSKSEFYPDSNGLDYFIRSFIRRSIIRRSFIRRRYILYEEVFYPAKAASTGINMAADAACTAL